MRTIALDPATWDLTADASGNIALASDPQGLAQDVASAVRVFRSEAWYDTTLGVPYLPRILGRTPGTPPPSPQFIRAQIVAAGMTTPDVAKIICFLSNLGAGRNLGGQLLVTSTSGARAVAQAADFTTPPWFVSAVSGEAAG